MKKFGLGCLLVLFAAVLLFTGCTKKAAPAAAVDPNAPVTLTVWCWDPNFNIYAMNEAAKVYRQDHPNVTVNVVETPWDDVQQKLITALSARQTDSLPDIVLMQDNAIQKNILTYPDAFLPVGDKIDLSKFAQFKVDVGTIDGKSYGVPFDNGATGTFLRRDIVEQAGLKVEDFNDITWERFIELGKIVKQKTGVTMVSTDATGPDFLMVMLQSAGTWLFDAQGKAYIKDNPVLRRAISLFIEGVQSGVILLASDWNAYIATLNNGTVASTIQGCWIIGSITPETSQAGNWALVNTPRFADIESVNYSSQGGSGWMVLASSKNPDAAIDFLDKTFAGSVEFYETILPSSGAIATWLPAADSTVYGQPNEFFGGQKIYEDLVNYAGKVPLVKYGIFNYEARSAVTRGMMDIMQGTKPIDSALNDAQQEVEFLMAQ
ncbi:MAG: extracellular solute-binding protein [Spirochaetaceae bacterium]|jgi:lactose/L-arabinose transport system substrate-binding protein|nr:extracellular solute-binding protein [Spirochaetaceae bacterium]